MLQSLIKRRDLAMLKFSSAEDAIAEAVLEGKAHKLPRLRTERDSALRDADECSDAIALAEERERDADNTAALIRQTELIDEAKTLAHEQCTMARKVDEALSALEQSVLAYEQAGRDFSTALRLAKLGDGGRMANRASQNIRWAVWHAAPRSAELMQVPRAPVDRRETLAELTRRMLPAINAEE